MERINALMDQEWIVGEIFKKIDVRKIAIAQIRSQNH